MYATSPYLNQAPRHLSKEDRLFWAWVYEQALGYTAIDEFYAEDAKLTADLVTRTHRAGCNSRGTMPDPGDVVELGTYLGVDFIDNEGTIHLDAYKRSDGKILMWSRSQKALICIPKLKRSTCQLPPVNADSALLRTWTQGRKSGKCSSYVDIPRPKLVTCRPGVAVRYWSDKFGSAETYIHHFDSAGVRVWFGAGREPAAIFIQGGQLRITEDGIAG